MKYIICSIAIALLILTPFIIRYIYKSIKNSKSFFEKAICYVCLFAVFVPIIIFYIDYCNTPTILGYLKEVDADRWFGFISASFGSLIGAFVSGLILVKVTRDQIENDNARKKEELFEQRKANNIPILKYTNTFYQLKPHTSILLMDGYDGKKSENCVLCFDVENIGLNTARNIYCVLKTKDDKYNAKTIESYPALKVGDSENIILITLFDVKKKKKLELVVTFYYDDLFNNHYSQDISMTVDFDEIKDCNIAGYELRLCGNMITYKEKDVE